MSPPVPSKNRDFRAEARALLRQWLAAEDSERALSIDGLGRQAMAAAAEASARLGRGVSATQSAERVLGELQALAEGFATPAAPARKSWFYGRSEPKPAPAPNLEALIQSLGVERDGLTRALIGMETDRSRLKLADEGLEDALALIRACAAMVDAAARELAIDRPDRAGSLREMVLPRLLSREHDLLTQLAVTRQGILALDLMAEGQQALAGAPDRARDTSVAALRTAIAARQAVSGSAALAQQADALARTVEAADAAPAERRDVQRALDDAMAQVRRSIEAAQARGGDRSLSP